VVTTLKSHSRVDPKALVLLEGAFKGMQIPGKRPVKERLSFKYFETPRGGSDMTTKEFDVTLEPGQTEVQYFDRSGTRSVKLYSACLQGCDQADPVYHDMDVDLNNPKQVRLLQRVNPRHKRSALLGPSRLN
jgi:hypothetical protein